MKESDSFAVNIIIIQGILLCVLLACIVFLVKNKDKPEQEVTEAQTETKAEEETGTYAGAQTETKTEEETGTYAGAQTETKTEEETEAAGVQTETKTEAENGNETTEVPRITVDAVRRCKVSGSSWLAEPEYDLYHYPEKAIDGDLQTGWCEGVPGDGIGEYLLFEFDQVYRISFLYIYAGYHKDGESDLYNKNGRPTLLKISGGGHNETVYLPDSKEGHTVMFEEPFITDMLKIEIIGVASGSAYSDTVISEIEFY